MVCGLSCVVWGVVWGGDGVGWGGVRVSCHGTCRVSCHPDHNDSRSPMEEISATADCNPMVLSMGLANTQPMPKNLLMGALHVHAPELDQDTDARVACRGGVSCAVSLLLQLFPS